MFSERRLIFVLLLVVPLAVALTIWEWPPTGCVSRVNCDRIQHGMTRAEVYHLLGGSGKAFMVYHGGSSHKTGLEFWHGVIWYANVTFDESGRVTRVKHGPRFEP